ncbi:hypothetical protein L7F22_046562, partial [Adiantum nelumboides]|nr:hypothetical protein [Adiantum nelumboides]
IRRQEDEQLTGISRAESTEAHFATAVLEQLHSKQRAGSSSWDGWDGEAACTCLLVNSGEVRGGVVFVAREVQHGQRGVSARAEVCG